MNCNIGQIIIPYTMYSTNSFSYISMLVQQKSIGQRTCCLYMSSP